MMELLRHKTEQSSRADHAPYDQGDALRMAEFFKALADPTRVRIISAILSQEICVHELAANLNMSQSAVSHQLRLLRNLRIVRHRRDGRHVYYALDDDHIKEMFERVEQHLGHL